MLLQVIYSARQRAQASSHGWCYSSGSAASGQSGSGNNWAMGHHQWGPRMAPAVLELVRKQVRWGAPCMLQLCAAATTAAAQKTGLQVAHVPASRAGVGAGIT
jgi:hypothetical protein